MSSTAPVTKVTLETVAELAAQLRVDSVRSSTSAGSGHPTSSTPSPRRHQREVIDCYSVKPVDSETSTSAARARVHGHPPSV